MVGALILNLGFAVDTLPDGVRNQADAWPSNLVLAIIGIVITALALRPTSELVLTQTETTSAA